jgi:hypothetical protein
MRKLVMAGFIIGAALASQQASAQTVNATLTLTGDLTTPRYNHTATLLRNGKVLVAVGAGPRNCDGPLTNTSELFDPVSGTWSATGNLNIARSNHAAALLRCLRGGESRGHDVLPRRSAASCWL